MLNRDDQSKNGNTDNIDLKLTHQKNDIQKKKRKKPLKYKWKKMENKKPNQDVLKSCLVMAQC